MVPYRLDLSYTFALRGTMYTPPALEINLSAPEKLGNVAELLEQDERRTLATHLIEMIGIDEGSMSDWLGEAKGYLDDLDAESNNAPQGHDEQEGSGEDGTPPATAMTLTAVIQFAARATDALLGEPDLVKASEPGGELIAAWASRQLRTEDQNWMLDTDPLIVHMAVTGLAWRKRKYESEDQAFFSRWLTVEQVIVNKNIRSVATAPRITEAFERYPYEIDRSIERKHWVDYNPTYDEQDTQAPKRFYECDLWIDLDGDNVNEPWTITLSRDDVPEVVKIEPRWSKKTIVDTKDELFFKPVPRYYPYKFLPDPKGGFLPKGFGWLLHSVEATADNLLASIVDTAKTEAQNGGVAAGGGFGMPDKVEVKGNRIAILPTDGQPLAQALQLFPSKSVSQGSVTVLEKTITLGDRIAGTLTLLENAPASMTATLAKGLIDNGQQVQSAIHRRLVSMLTQECRAFVRMADQYDQLPAGLSGADGGNIAVTADPQLATEMQRGAQAGIYFQMLEHPMAFSVQEAASRICQVMRLPNPEKLVAPAQQPQASPWEKIQGVINLEKARNDRIKAMALLALNISGALKNLVAVHAGTVDIQAALLQLATLEHTMQGLMKENADASNGLDSLAQQPGDPSGTGAVPPQGPGDDGQVLGGAGAGPGDAGPGSGLA